MGRAAAELSGAKIPPTARLDGYSLVPFLKGGPAPQRECFYWELHEGTPLQAVRFAFRPAAAHSEFNQHDEHSQGKDSRCEQGATLVPFCTGKKPNDEQTCQPEP